MIILEVFQKWHTNCKRFIIIIVLLMASKWNMVVPRNVPFLVLAIPFTVGQKNKNTKKQTIHPQGDISSDLQIFLTLKSSHKDLKLDQVEESGILFPGSVIVGIFPCVHTNQMHYFTIISILNCIPSLSSPTPQHLNENGIISK